MEAPHENCACVFCERVRHQVQSAESWDREHAACLTAVVAKNAGAPSLLDMRAAEFREEVFNHPSGLWFWKICPRGHRHLRIRHEETTDAR
jgi:hypothetical protein